MEYSIIKNSFESVPVVKMDETGTNYANLILKKNIAAILLYIWNLGR